MIYEMQLTLRVDTGLFELTNPDDTKEMLHDALVCLQQRTGDAEADLSNGDYTEKTWDVRRICLDAEGLSCCEDHRPSLPVEVVLNGEILPVGKLDHSYEEIVQLAKCTGHPTVVWVTPGEGRKGSLCPGEHFQICQGMRIEVCHTGNA